MSETYTLNTASVVMRDEEEPYTRADGTQGKSKAGMTIKTNDGAYVRLDWIDAFLLYRLLVKERDRLAEHAGDGLERLHQLLGLTEEE